MSLYIFNKLNQKKNNNMSSADEYDEEEEETEPETETKQKDDEEQSLVSLLFDRRRPKIWIVPKVLDRLQLTEETVAGLLVNVNEEEEIKYSEKHYERVRIPCQTTKLGLFGDKIKEILKKRTSKAGITLITDVVYYKNMAPINLLPLHRELCDFQPVPDKKRKKYYVVVVPLDNTEVRLFFPPPQKKKRKNLLNIGFWNHKNNYTQIDPDSIAIIEKKKKFYKTPFQVSGNAFLIVYAKTFNAMDLF